MTGEAASRSGPEVLWLGSTSIDRRLQRTLAIFVVVLALLAGGSATWRLWPRTEPLTLDELQHVYAGLVRTDGVNPASVLDPNTFRPRPARVAPAECAPLFGTTMFGTTVVSTSTVDQVPTSALDGVGTFWRSQQTTIALFTLRYASTEVAGATYGQIASALAVCQGTTVRLRFPRRIAGSRPSGTLQRVAGGTRRGRSEQSGYLVATGPDGSDGMRYAVHVLTRDNTVTWQYRYESTLQPYAASAAQRLMDGFATQLRSVLALRR